MKNGLTFIVIGLLLLSLSAALWVTNERLRSLPNLDDCAREANVYRCEWVAQPVKPALLPPPVGG